jgi:cell division protein FtsB
MGLATHRAERAAVKRGSRRRKRGGDGRAPVRVQRLARNVLDTADSAQHAARGATAAALAGDRPLWVGLLVLVAAGSLMLVGPFQSYLDGSARVDLLERQHSALGSAIAELEQERDDLMDETTIELRAREQLGMIKPGEVPFAMVPPEVERPLIAPARDVASADAPWYRRWWETVADWVT